jgi:UDP-N-acetylglucosamine acyltransferase
MIHSSAIVDPTAELDENVSVGPFCVIAAQVRIGSGSEIGPHVVINGSTDIGHDNRIYQFASVGENPQDRKYAGEVTRLEIGDRNVIREFATINRGTVQEEGITRIGSDNLFMAYTHVAHDCSIGNNIIMANAASLGGHVQIDDWAILGGFTLVHQFARVGAYSFSGMGSAIGKDVPPYMMVEGRPARPRGINSEGLKRQGFSQEALTCIRSAYKMLYKSGLSLEEAISRIAAMPDDTAVLHPMVQFLRSRARSIIR